MNNSGVVKTVNPEKRKSFPSGLSVSLDFLGNTHLSPRIEESL